MDARTERIILYAVVLALAIAVGWLAFATRNATGPVGDCVGCGDEIGPRFDAIDAALGSIGETVDGVADTVDRGLAGFRQDLAGLEARVAEAVSRKLLAEGCQLTRIGGECVQDPTPRPPGPTPLTVRSKFTFLYDNARLNEDGEIAQDSLGVKLEPRHETRLDRIANAFGPCDKADDPVRFAVTGYSSSAEFRSQPGGGALANSRHLNRETARLRAQIVRDYLKSKGFEVAPPEHDLARPYRDDAQPEVDQQALNRTVFVELKSAGACGLS